MSILLDFLRLSATVLVLAGSGVLADQPRAPDPDDPEPPALSLQDNHGGTYTLADLRGKVVLVNFWASWCGPCITEIPSLRELYDRMAGEPFEVLAVNVKEGRFRVHKFSQMLAMPFPVLLDPDGAVFDSWGARVLPTSFLIDAEGRVHRKVVGPLDWASAEAVTSIRALLPAPSATLALPTAADPGPATPDSPAD